MNLPESTYHEFVEQSRVKLMHSVSDSCHKFDEKAVLKLSSNWSKDKLISYMFGLRNFNNIASLLSKHGEEASKHLILILNKLLFQCKPVVVLFTVCLLQVLLPRSRCLRNSVFSDLALFFRIIGKSKLNNKSMEICYFMLNGWAENWKDKFPRLGLAARYLMKKVGSMELKSEPIGVKEEDLAKSSQYYDYEDSLKLITEIERLVSEAESIIEAYSPSKKLTSNVMDEDEDSDIEWESDNEDVVAQELPSSADHLRNDYVLEISLDLEKVEASSFGIPENNPFDKKNDVTIDEAAEPKGTNLLLKESLSPVLKLLLRKYLPELRFINPDHSRLHERIREQKQLISRLKKGFSVREIENLTNKPRRKKKKRFRSQSGPKPLDPFRRRVKGLAAGILLGRRFFFKTMKMSYQAEVCRQNSKSFYFASLLFKKSVREKIYTFYAFARTADDLIDEASTNLQQKRNIEMLAQLIVLMDVSKETTRDRVIDAITANKKGFEISSRDRTLNITGETDNPLHMHNFTRIILDFYKLVKTARIPAWALQLLLQGFKHDTETNEIKDETELLHYCLGVASSIGIICVYIFRSEDSPLREPDEAVLAKACSLGIAMQLTNIARDIVTDAEMKRTYIPNTWLAENGLTSTEFINMEATMREPYLQLFSLRIVAMAETYYKDAWDGLDLLPKSARGAVASALLIYREIGLLIAEGLSKGEKYPKRAHTSKLRKIYLHLKSKAQLLLMIIPAFTPGTDVESKTRSILKNFQESLNN